MNAPGLLIGVDVGSGGSKVSIIEETGALLSEGRCSHPSIHVHPGWVEQEPEDWYRSAVAALREALEGIDVARRRDVRAISFSGPHHVAVLLDGDDRPVRPAIMWNDQRSHRESVELAESDGERIRAITGNSPAPTWTLPQLHWLRRHEPEALSATRSILFLKDYVRFRFTGVKKTDRIEAQGTLFFDVHQGVWADSLFEATGLDRTLLPEVAEPASRAGELQPEFAAETGLGVGTPVVTGSADSVMEILASGVVRVGDVAAKLATAGNVVAVSDRLPEDARFLAYEHLVPGRFYWNSATSAAAASLRWFTENIAYPTGAATGEHFASLDDDVLSVRPGAEGLLFLPFLNGERSPHWDPRLRGSFFGLTSGHDRRHLARAVMEGVALSLRDAADVHPDALPDAVRLIGGGARSRAWPQIVADVLARTIELVPHGDSSYGTALTAGVGVGVFADFDAASDVASGAATAIAHDPSRHARYRVLSDIYRRLTTVTGSIAHDLGDFAEVDASQEDA